MTKQEILGGNVECYTGSWDDCGNALMQVDTKTTKMDIGTCKYIEKCINNFDEARNLLLQVASGNPQDAMIKIDVFLEKTRDK